MTCIVFLVINSSKCWDAVCVQNQSSSNFRTTICFLFGIYIAFGLSPVAVGISFFIELCLLFCISLQQWSVLISYLLRVCLVLVLLSMTVLHRQERSFTGAVVERVEWSNHLIQFCILLHQYQVKHKYYDQYYSVSRSQCPEVWFDSQGCNTGTYKVLVASRATWWRFNNWNSVVLIKVETKGL